MHFFALRFLTCLISTLLTVTPFATAAATPSASKLKIKPPKSDPIEDVDSIITNKKMRAESGSRSKYSLSTSLYYSGGSLAHPFGDHKPNITGAAGTTDFPAMGGSVAGKYNINGTNSLFGGFGVRWVAPLSGTQGPRGYDGNRFDADTPYLSFLHLYRLGSLQSSFSVRESWTTTSDLRRKGYVTNWGISNYSLHDFQDLPFSFGIGAYVGIAYFDKDDAKLKAEQSDYSFGVAPALEYRISDRLTAHIDTNLLAFDHLRSAKPGQFRRQEPTQNLSAGYAITRDFFISPGVAFTVGKLSLQRTNWSLGASLNLF